MSQQGLHLPAEHPLKSVNRPGKRQDALQGPDQHEGGVWLEVLSDYSGLLVCKYGRYTQTQESV